MRIVGLMIGLLAVTGCASAPVEPSGPVDVQVILAPGQQTDVEGTTLRLRFDAVVGDSRCPADALCILGGDAIVRIAVLTNRGGETIHDLHTGIMQPVRRHDGLTIALVELNPYPFSGRTTPQADYRARFRVTR